MVNNFYGNEKLAANVLNDIRWISQGNAGLGPDGKPLPKSVADVDPRFGAGTWKGDDFIEDPSYKKSSTKEMQLRRKLPINKYTLPLVVAGTVGGSAAFSKESLADTLKSGWFWGDMATGFDTESIARGMQKKHLEESGETYRQSADRSGKFWRGLLTGDWINDDDRSEWVSSWKSPKKKREELESIWT